MVCPFTASVRVQGMTHTCNYEIIQNVESDLKVFFCSQCDTESSFFNYCIQNDSEFCVSIVDSLTQNPEFYFCFFRMTRNFSGEQSE